MSDDDARDLFAKHGQISKDRLEGDEKTVLIKGGNLEKLMRDIDPETYDRLKQEFGNSKPAIAYEFARAMQSKEPEILNSLKKFLVKAIEISKN